MAVIAKEQFHFHVVTFPLKFVDMSKHVSHLTVTTYYFVWVLLQSTTCIFGFFFFFFFFSIFFFTSENHFNINTSRKWSDFKVNIHELSTNSINWKTCHLKLKKQLSLDDELTLAEDFLTRLDWGSTRSSLGRGEGANIQQFQFRGICLGSEILQMKS